MWNNSVFWYYCKLRCAFWCKGVIPLLYYSSHLGCPKKAYKNWENGGVFTKTVNLHIGGTKKTNVDPNNYNCSLHGSYFDYNGFQVRWKRVTNDVFKLIIQDGQQKKFTLQVTSY